MKRELTKKIATVGIFSAISILLVAVIHFPIFPAAPFLEYDPANIPIFICTFLYGPLTGIIMTVVVAVLQGLTVSAQSGVYGIIMHLIATGTSVLVIGFIYKAKKTKKRALLALLVGELSMVAVMIPANIWITPAFMGVPTSMVLDLILPAIIPFNLVKAVINCTVTFFIYKYISKSLKKMFTSECQ